MGLYARYVLPKVVDWTCGTGPVSRQRAKVVPEASGTVLEIGVGSGLNLPYYDARRVTKLWGLEPAPAMRRLAQPRVRALDIPFEFVALPGDQIPLDAASVDTVVITYTLCTIPDATEALRDMARVLRPGGRLLFCEHGAAPDRAVRRWQNWVNPVWQRLGGGCQLNRDIPTLIRDAGFDISTLETMYIPGWRPASFNYWGSAVPR